MNKIDLITALGKQHGISRGEAEWYVEFFFDSLASALAKGQRVEIRGLCTFKVKEYPAYTGRNPKTGQKVAVKAKKLPFFKPGKDLKERVDRSTDG